MSVQMSVPVASVPETAATGPALRLCRPLLLRDVGAAADAETKQPAYLGERRLETGNLFMLIYFMILTG